MWIETRSWVLQSCFLNTRICVSIAKLVYISSSSSSPLSTVIENTKTLPIPIRKHQMQTKENPLKVKDSSEHRDFSTPQTSFPSKTFLFRLSTSTNAKSKKLYCFLGQNFHFTCVLVALSRRFLFCGCCCWARIHKKKKKKNRGGAHVFYLVGENGFMFYLFFE